MQIIVATFLFRTADGYSIYIKGLPMSATPAMLDDEFKKFGSIKPNGIQVRSNRVCIHPSKPTCPYFILFCFLIFTKLMWQQQGFCFGFVEFEAPDAVQKAIEVCTADVHTSVSVYVFK